MTNYVGQSFVKLLAEGIPLMRADSYELIDNLCPIKDVNKLPICVDLDNRNLIVYQYDLMNLQSFFFTYKTLTNQNFKYFCKYYIGIKAINLDHAFRVLRAKHECFDENNFLVTTKKPTKLQPILLVWNPYINKDNKYYPIYKGNLNVNLVSKIEY